MFRLMARSISEIATMVIGVLGMGWRLILCKLWHRVGIVVTTEAATTPGKSGSKPRSIEVVLGGQEQGNEGNDILGGVREQERFQIWEQKFAGGTELQHQESFQWREPRTSFFKLSYPPSISMESSPLQLRWEPSEILEMSG